MAPGCLCILSHSCGIASYQLAYPQAPTHVKTMHLLLGLGQGKWACINMAQAQLIRGCLQRQRTIIWQSWRLSAEVHVPGPGLAEAHTMAPQQSQTPPLHSTDFA